MGFSTYICWESTVITGQLTHSPILHSKLSPINLVSIFGCSSSPYNPVYTRRVGPSVLVFSLSFHRHPHICISFTYHFIYCSKINNFTPSPISFVSHPHPCVNFTIHIHISSSVSQMDLVSLPVIQDVQETLNNREHTGGYCPIELSCHHYDPRSYV